MQFHFLVNLNLIMFAVKVAKKNINREDINKSRKTIISIAKKELWLIFQGCPLGLQLFNFFFQN